MMLLTVLLTDAPRHPLKTKVEAGGIEPPSESLPPFDYYVCSPRFNLGFRSSHGRDFRYPVLVISPTWPQASKSASPHSDGPAPTHGPRSGGPRTKAG